MTQPYYEGCPTPLSAIAETLHTIAQELAP